MKGIEKLTFASTEQIDELLHSANQYKRFVRVYFEILTVEDNIINVKVTQQESALEKYLSAKELKERTIEVFSNVVPLDWNLFIVPSPYLFLKEVDIDYVNKKKDELGLTVEDLSRYFSIRPQNMDRILTNKRKLSKFSKAAFYYLFKYLEN